MNEKYDSFKKYCVGRSVLQLPNEFSMLGITTGSFESVDSRHQALAFEVVVDSALLKKESFLNHLLTRRYELKRRGGEAIDVLRLEQKLSDSSTLFRVQQFKDTYKSELHFATNGSLVVVTVDSYGNTFLAAERGLVDFMSNFSPVENEQNNGFCLGPLVFKGNFSAEDGEYDWRDDTGNTLKINISTFKTNSADTLLLRMAGPGSLLDLFHVGHTVLRAGERTVAGMRAQEWLGWTNLGRGGDEKTFKFVSETMRPVGTRNKPLIAVTFDSAQKLENGTETKTNLSDKEAMALWDKILGSIRMAE